jgi:gliding motility-associated lipoprotein GldH
MANSKYTLLYIGALVLFSVFLTACKENTVYYHYEQTSLAGWEKNDTLTFAVGPLSASGSYKEEIGLRISGAYPFMSLNLIIEQRNASKQVIDIDTLVCNLINRQGNAEGQGVSQFQYIFPLKTMDLQEGEQLFVSVRHDMKRDILPGVADIGLRLLRNN